MKTLPPDTNNSPIELCGKCKRPNTTYQYDFNKRCCRARHTLDAYDLPHRVAHYQSLEEKYGNAFANQHIQDVKELRKFRQENQS